VLLKKRARKLASLPGRKKPNQTVRAPQVVGGGCSGLQYVMDLVDGPKERGYSGANAKTSPRCSIQKARFSVSGSVLDYSERPAKRRL